jgi:hypothetical protein
VGNKGTNLNLEMYKSDSNKEETAAASKGVVKDDKGNIYKVTYS